MAVWTTQESRNAVVEMYSESREITPGTPFKQTITEMGREAGLKEMKVYLNGEELNPANAPATFRAGDVVKIRPYDKAA